MTSVKLNHLKFQINETENSLFKQDFIDTFLERNQKHTSKTVSHPIAKLQQNVKITFTNQLKLGFQKRRNA